MPVFRNSPTRCAQQIQTLLQISMKSGITRTYAAPNLPENATGKTWETQAKNLVREQGRACFAVIDTEPAFCHLRVRRPPSYQAVFIGSDAFGSSFGSDENCGMTRAPPLPTARVVCAGFFSGQHQIAALKPRRVETANALRPT
jgi:hypothetical protein